MEEGEGEAEEVPTRDGVEEVLEGGDVEREGRNGGWRGRGVRRVRGRRRGGGALDEFIEAVEEDEKGDLREKGN